MTIIFDKPFKTYTQQVEHLKKKYNLNISNNVFAEDALSAMSYYDLINGYKECFLSNNKFNKDITIEFLYMFYLFDKGFQNILFRQSMFIENAFKTKLAYILSKNISVDINDYLDSSHYTTKSYGKLTFQDVKNEIESHTYKSPKPPQPTKHYVDNHNHIPPWILFKNISFSNAINILLFLNANDKAEIINSIISKNVKYKEKVDFLLTALNIIRDFRNKIAHNLKFVTHRYDYRPLKAQTSKKIISPVLLSWDDIKQQNRGLCDIYSMILSIIALQKDKFLTQTFLNELITFITPQNISENEMVKNALYNHYANITNLPNDLAQRLITYRNTL